MVGLMAQVGVQGTIFKVRMRYHGTDASTWMIWEGVGAGRGRVTELVQRNAQRLDG